MKKKLLAFALISVLAISALGLAACGTEFSETYIDPYENKALVQQLNQIKVLNSQKNIDLDYDTNNLNPNTVLFVASKIVDGKIQRVVYNIETENIVGTFNNTDTVSYQINCDALLVKDTYYDLFMVTKDTYDPDTDEDTYEYTLYNFDGTTIATSDEMPDFKIDTLFFGKDYYRVNKDGKFEKAGSLAENAAPLPNFNALNNGRYYYFNGDELFIYDNSFVLTNYYQIPSYANPNGMFVLNNGNVLIQYEYNVSNYDNDYTYFDGADNLKVITQLYNVKDGSTKDVDTVCIFNGLSARDSEPFGIIFRMQYNNSIENLGNVSYITNKRVDNNVKTVSVKNDGSIDRILNESILAQDGDPEAISSGRFVVTTKDGSTYLVNASGEIIANISGIDTDDDINQKYIVLNGKIYDHDFKELASFDEDKWNVQLMNNTVVLNSVENAKQYKLYVNGEVKEITLGDNEYVAGGNKRMYYTCKMGDTNTYTYYNENGEVLLADYPLSLVYRGTARNGKALLTGYDVANEKYVNIVLSTVEEK